MSVTQNSFNRNLKRKVCGKDRVEENGGTNRQFWVPDLLT